jgi:hypothetical protein
MRLGIHPRTLYALRDDAHLVRMDRALYRVADPEPFGNSDLVMWLSKFTEGSGHRGECVPPMPRSPTEGADRRNASSYVGYLLGYDCGKHR